MMYSLTESQFKSGFAALMLSMVLGYGYWVINRLDYLSERIGKLEQTQAGTAETIKQIAVNTENIRAATERFNDWFLGYLAAEGKNRDNEKN